MPAEYKYTAVDKTTGMTFEELNEALKDFSVADAKKYRLKAVVGFKGQVQSITFVEVTNGPAQA